MSASGQPFSAQNAGYEPLGNARQRILFSSSLESPTFHTARVKSGQSFGRPERPLSDPEQTIAQPSAASAKGHEPTSGRPPYLIARPPRSPLAKPCIGALSETPLRSDRAASYTSKRARRAPRVALLLDCLAGLRLRDQNVLRLLRVARPTPTTRQLPACRTACPGSLPQRMKRHRRDIGPFRQFFASFSDPLQDIHPSKPQVIIESLRADKEMRPGPKILRIYHAWSHGPIAARQYQEREAHNA